MPQSVTAILVAADGAGYLRETLDAITLQTRLPDRLVVIQLGTSPVTTAIVDGVEPTVHARVSARAGFGRAVEVGVKSAGLETLADDWFWLLGSDNAPDPRALERLVHAVEAAPSVAIAGPKQMQWDAPDYLHSFGETMTPLGTAVEMAEPELDQAQYDRQSDVLAVAAGGMFVSAAVWDQLGGFDLALPAVDDALDFCVRARLAGHRVQLVPHARVRSAGIDAPGTRLLGVSTTPGRRARLQREAQLHRRLAYAPLAAVPLHWLSVLPLGVLRALGQILRKQPGSAPAELLAALIVVATCFAGVARARARIARNRSAGWAAIAPLRQSWREVRHRRALARDNGRPAARRQPTRFVSGGGLATVLTVAAVALVLFHPLIGAPAVSGGGLLPLGGFTSLWRSVGWGVHPLGVGFVGPADPFALVLALLGSLTPWHPSAAVVGLWLVALPVAAAGGWLAAARFTRRGSLRIVGAVLWTVAPAFVVALDTGRIAPVLIHLAAPFALLAAFQVRRSWTASAWLALLGALIAAAAPSLLPLLIACWIAGLVLVAARRGPDGARLGPMLSLPLPTLVLFLPLVAEQAMQGRLIGVLADPGPVADPPAVASVLGLPGQLSTVLQLAAGWPVWAEETWIALTAPLGLEGDAVALFVFTLGAPLLLLAAVGLFWPRRSVPIRVAIAGVGGLVVAVLATKLQVVASGATPVPAWPGAGLSLAWLGLLEAAVCGLDRLAASGTVPFADRLGRVVARVRSMGTAVVGFTAVVAVIAAVSPLLAGILLGSSRVQAGPAATVPALVAAESDTVPGLGLLTLTPQPDGGYAERLVRGDGQTLERLSTLQSTVGLGESVDLARLTAGLVQPTGDDLAAALNAFRIGYVLLEPPAADTRSRSASASAEGSLSANPLLARVSSTAVGTLYRYRTLDPSAPPAVLRGPANTATPLGLLVLGVQGLVLVLTALLALPTGRLTARFRPVAAGAAPAADVSATRAAAAAARPRTPEQVMVRELRRPGPAAEVPEPVPEEVGAWR